MIVSLQLISLLINFIYGFILFFLSYINYLFIEKEPLLVKILITLVFMLDYTFLYLIIFYKLTSGIFHIFYLFIFILGYYVGYIFKINSVFKKTIDLIIKKIPKK